MWHFIDWLHNFMFSTIIIYILTAENLEVCLSFFWKTTWWISLKLCHCLLSTALRVINNNPKCVATSAWLQSVKFVKIYLFWPQFMVIFVHFFAHGILSNYRMLTAENWPRDAEHIVVRSCLYQIKQYPLSAMVFASFLGVFSNTDHRHFAFRTFPKL